MSISLPLNHHARQIVGHVQDWLTVEKGQHLNETQKKQLGQLVQQGLTQVEQQTQDYLAHQLDISPASNTMAKPLLANVQHAIQGKPATSWALTHAMAFVYVPSAILAPIVMNTIYKRSGKVSDQRRHDLVNQDISYRVSGAAIHFVQTYGGKLVADGIKAVAQQHLHLTRMARQLETSAWTRPLVPITDQVAQGLRRTWHTLQDTRGDTALSLAMITLFNTIGYGVIRPLIHTSTMALTLKPEMTASCQPTPVTEGHPKAMSTAMTGMPVVNDRLTPSPFILPSSC